MWGFSMLGESNEETLLSCIMGSVGLRIYGI